MKIKALFLLILMVMSAATMAQRNKKQATADSTVATEAKADSTKAIVDSPKPKNDSLKNVRASDSLKYVKVYDSLNAQIVLYKNFYKYINEKFFPEKFRNIEVQKAVALADSLTLANNSKWKGIEALSKSKIDSMALLLRTADTLRIQNQTFKALLISLIGENVYPLNEGELKGAWQVFVQPLRVTGAGLESAAVSLDRLILPDSLYRASIKQIVFLEEDLADVYFFGGRKTKVFYKVTGFSRDKTYSISLQKGSEINTKLFVTSTPRGLQVSYKVGTAPGQFMFGYMRK